MAGKNPAELKKEGEDLKAVFARVKKKQHNCAILTSKDGIVVETHLKKAPEILLKAAKKKGGTAKGAWGTITMEGQVLILDPVNEKVPGSLPKIAKKFFTERGLKFRLEIKEPEEEENGAAEAEAMEEEAEETAASSADESAEADETPDQQEDENEAGEGEASSAETSAPASGDEQKAELEQRMDDVQGDVDALLAGEQNIMATALEDELKKFERGMDEPDYDYATRSMDLIDEILEDYAALKEKQQPLLDRVDRLDRGIQAVLRGEDDDAAEELQTMLDEFNYNLAKSELVSAGQKLDLIEQLTEAHAGAPEEEGAETGEGHETKASEGNADAENEKEDLSDVESNSDKLRRANMKTQINDNKKAINAILKNKDSENAKSITAALLKYTKGLKGGDLDGAQTSVDEIDDVLAKAESEFTLTETQRSAIMKELDKMTSDIASLTKELAN